MADTKKPIQAPPVAFRDIDLEPQLAARAGRDTSVGQVAKRDLARYYELAAANLRTVSASLTRGEKLLLCDLSSGTLWDYATANLVWAEVADATTEEAEKWNVDQDALVSKLRALSSAERLALVDALERFWLLPAEGRGTHDESLQAVGLA